jgi:glyoxylase-like metal-dependent hydrolase (beta-lactamase superfamily II)
VTVGSAPLEVIHTPGHSDDHLCFLTGRILFTGDHIMGGSSVMVDDMASYLRSLRRLQDLDLDRLYPGHGPEIERPQEVISWYIAHRLQREQEILEAIAEGARGVDSIVESVYRSVDRALHPLAARSVAAHLRKLEAEGRIPGP